tara:strand:- start:2049 stop:2945 length:897 start_codon:yes stop_codon:yes gene_type:complete
MKVLLTGSSGQLGQAIINNKPKGIDLITPNRNQVDLIDSQLCMNIVEKINPDWVVNCAAYTSVDKAESEPKLAIAINTEAPRAFSKALLKTGGKLLHLSTDFVFNGNQGNPYRVSQSRAPLGVYGSSKAGGEVEIEKILKGKNQSVILRTSWLMGPVGNNFVLTMIKLHNEKDKLKVISDQVGGPTSTLTLSSTCWQLINQSEQIISSKGELPMIMHWSDSGVASWYDIAIAIGEIGKELGLINNPAQVLPITTANYPSAAKRPGYSLLDSSETKDLLNLPAIHWRTALRDILLRVSL